MSVRDLHDAIQNKQTEKALSLLKNPEIKNCINEKVDGWNSLHRACIHGLHSVTKALLQCGADTEVEGNAENRAIHYAVFEGHTECLRELIKYRCDMNAQNGVENTALHYSSQYGHFECTRELIKAGCDVRIKNSNGKTAFMLSPSHSDSESPPSNSDTE